MKTRRLKDKGNEEVNLAKQEGQEMEKTMKTKPKYEIGQTVWFNSGISGIVEGRVKSRRGKSYVMEGWEEMRVYETLIGLTYDECELHASLSHLRAMLDAATETMRRIDEIVDRMEVEQE